MKKTDIIFYLILIIDESNRKLNDESIVKSVKDENKASEELQPSQQYKSFFNKKQELFFDCTYNISDSTY